METAKYVGVQEIADELGMDIQTIRRWIHSGKLPAIKPGLKYLVLREDLDAFLGARSTDPLGEAPSSTGDEQERRGDEDDPLVEFADRYTERWAERIATGDFDLGAVDEFIKTVGDLMPTLHRLNEDEMLVLPRQPYSSFGAPASKTGAAIERLSSLISPLARAVGAKFEDSEFGQRLVQRIAEQEGAQEQGQRKARGEAG